MWLFKYLFCLKLTICIDLIAVFLRVTFIFVHFYDSVCERPGKCPSQIIVPLRATSILPVYHVQYSGDPL